MTRDTQDRKSRTRFCNVIHEDQLDWDSWARDTGRYGSQTREAAVALGARDLGYCIVSVDPGRRSCPYHFHHSEEEVFYVLKGRARLRQGDQDGEEQVALGPGDFISFPAGTGVAHQFINDSDEPFVFLAMSNRIKADVAEYPDSDKVLVRGSRMMLRRSPTLDYFDGEV